MRQQWPLTIIVVNFSLFLSAYSVFNLLIHFSLNFLPNRKSTYARKYLIRKVHVKEMHLSSNTSCVLSTDALESKKAYSDGVTIER